MTRTVAVVTGTRADPLGEIMEGIQNHDDLSLSVVATGMHLSPAHGNTIGEIEAKGFPVDRKISMLLEGDSGKAMAKSVGIGLASLAEAFDSLDPNVVLILGDRFEDLAAGIAASHMNIPLAHIHGGDVMSGSIIDDSIRHAITKFAHIHFPATEQSAENIRRLGEEPWRIEVVGDPGLDAIDTGAYELPNTVLRNYGFDPNQPLAVVVQHPLTTNPEQAPSQMETTLAALESFSGNIVIIYSNADAGGKRIIDVIDRWIADSEANFAEASAFESLPREEYLGLLSGADVLVGNSSSGVIEAPSFGLPVVDIGPRQTGRERAENVLSVNHDRAEIEDAIERALTDGEFQDTAKCADNPYYKDRAAERVVTHLAEVDLSERLLQKRITYLDDAIESELDNEG